MRKPKNIHRRFYIARASWRRRFRLLFPSPAEVRFIRIMGGHILVINFIKNPSTGFPLAWVVSLGRVLKRERVEREVRCGAFFVDFGVVTPYYKKGIEIDGRRFHRDVTKEQNRDDYCWNYGWVLLHIDAADLYRNPNFVQRQVLIFLSK